MTLSALERLDLSDQLDDLMIKAASAKGLDLLDISDEIDDVMVRLGYGAAAVATPEPVPDSDPQSNDLVSDYLADKYLGQSLEDFTSTLISLEPFVNQSITMDQVREHAANWLANSSLAA